MTIRTTPGRTYTELLRRVCVEDVAMPLGTPEGAAGWVCSARHCGRILGTKTGAARTVA